MKNYILIPVFLFTSLLCFSQKRETIKGLAEVYHEKAWYKEQAVLWREEVRKNPTDEEAWINLHMATIRSHGRSQGEEGKVSRDLVKEIERVLPNTFVAYFAKADQMSDKGEEAQSYLERAHALEPDNLILYSDLIACYELNDHLGKRKALNKKWFESGKYSTGILNFTRNVLTSLEPNAVIFSGGDNDTFPMWMLQDVKNIRTDVTIINVPLIGVESYQKRVLAKLGVKLSKEEQKEVDRLSGVQSNIPARFLNMIELLTNKTNRPIYMGVWFGGDFMKSIEKDLYLTGLVNRYSKTRIDNLALLKKHFIYDYHLDYLEIQNYIETRPQPVRWLDQSYITGLLTLHKHFKGSNDLQNVAFCKKYIRLLANNSPNKEEILAEIK